MTLAGKRRGSGTARARRERSPGWDRRTAGERGAARRNGNRGWSPAGQAGILMVREKAMAGRGAALGGLGRTAVARPSADRNQRMQMRGGLGGCPWRACPSPPSDPRSFVAGTDRRRAFDAIAGVAGAEKRPVWPSGEATPAPPSGLIGLGRRGRLVGWNSSGTRTRRAEPVQAPGRVHRSGHGVRRSVGHHVFRSGPFRRRRPISDVRVLDRWPPARCFPHGSRGSEPNHQRPRGHAAGEENL